MRSALIASMILVTASGPALAQETLVDIQLEELWRVDDSHDLIGRVRDIEVDTSGNVYVLDQQLNLVHVYSADGTHLRNIGREGDGPGEFRRSQDLLITSEGLVGVLESVPGKIVLLDPDGVPAGQVPLPPQPDGATITLQSAGCAGGNLVIYHFQRVFGEQFVDQSCLIQAVEPDGSAGVVYAEMFVRDVPNQMVIDDTERGPVLQRWKVGPDGSVWLAEGYTEYRIRTWAPDGTPRPVIEREYEPYARSAEQISEMRDRIEHATRNFPGDKEIRVSDYELSIVDFHVFPDESCWVLTSRGQREAAPGTIGNWDEFDDAGNFVRQVVLHGEGHPVDDQVFLRGNRLYLVRVDEETQSTELICYEPRRD